MITQKQAVSILAELPEHLHQAIQGYLNDHPDWDYDRFMVAAVSLFLLQNGGSSNEVSRAYLDALFNPGVLR